VEQANVLVRELGPNEQRLVAYVTGRQGQDVSPAALRAYLGKQLPSYMVPRIVSRMSRREGAPGNSEQNDTAASLAEHTRRYRQALTSYEPSMLPYDALRAVSLASQLGPALVDPPQSCNCHPDDSHVPLCDDSLTELGRKPVRSTKRTDELQPENANQELSNRRPKLHATADAQGVSQGHGDCNRKQSMVAHPSYARLHRCTRGAVSVEYLVVVAVLGLSLSMILIALGGDAAQTWSYSRRVLYGASP
jgi:hypothetical protein